MTNERVYPVFVQCRICENFKMLYVREEDWREYQKPNRGYIQDIFPYLTSEERELLLSHTCPDCWKRLFGGEDDE